MKIFEIDNKINIRETKRYSTVKYKNKYIKIDHNKVWNIKKVLFNMLKVSVCRIKLYYKDRELKNGENSSKYDYVTIKLQKRR